MRGREKPEHTMKGVSAEKKFARKHREVTGAGDMSPWMKLFFGVACCAFMVFSGWFFYLLLRFSKNGSSTKILAAMAHGQMGPIDNGDGSEAAHPAAVTASAGRALVEARCEPVDFSILEACSVRR